MNETIFLLGGYDLEMKEIRAILTDLGCRFVDRNLCWGAKLSDYQDILNDSDWFSGIELTTDITPPLHYELIDHHNENSDRTSSIEQIATKLGVILNPKQKLIAANDTGYIPAMVSMGASEQEIGEIRRLDREAQGVTDHDELLAQESIRDHLSVNGHVTMVKSLTNRFSAITDRLYPCERLLVYTERELAYYGIGAAKLQYRFPDLIKENKVYFGGGPDGFFGVKQNLLSTRKLENTRNAIIDVINQH